MSNVTLTLTDDQAEALAVAARAWGDLLTGQQPPIPLKFADDQAEAAAESLLLQQLALKITTARDQALTREIDPADLESLYLIRIDDSELLLLPPDVAQLRRLLLVTDETAPAKVGEPLSLPTRFKGQAITEVTPELLAAKQL